MEKGRREEEARRMLAWIKEDKRKDKVDKREEKGR